ncbi:hypothetical protein BJ742DRAFT_740890 [Cladochytrium replicatum]|nr:hypothetical protein BJ742DRAFT_740890 [Cladochytrium replicatum]
MDSWERSSRAHTQSNNSWVKMDIATDVVANEWFHTFVHFGCYGSGKEQGAADSVGLVEVDYFRDEEWTTEALDWAKQTGRLKIPDWWKWSGIIIEWSYKAMDGASGLGSVDTLNWWRSSREREDHRNGKLLKDNPANLVPSGFGRQTCPGITVPRHELFLAITHHTYWVSIWNTEN